MRPRLVVGNWKMNPPTVQEATALARSCRETAHARVNVGVAPPAVALAAVADALRGSDVMVYAQDVHWEDRGAYTGQLSAGMLRPAAVGTIVGHSEVRRDQCDDDARVARKAGAALRAGLRVVYCLGESLEERRGGETGAVLRRQVAEGIGRIDRARLLGPLASRLAFAIAYEPIWAIGTGEPATGEQASDAVATVRRELAGCGLDGDAVPVLYGGSVTAANADEFAAAHGVDGALVGGASLDPQEFAAIVRSFGGS